MRKHHRHSPATHKILEKFCSANMEAHQALELLDHQGYIRSARFIEFEQAHLNAQSRSLLTSMLSWASWLTCETNKRISKFLDIVSSHADYMDMVYENYDSPGTAIRVYGDNYWSTDPPGDLFRIQGCVAAANKHPLKDLGQLIGDDYIALSKFPDNWHVVPASGHYLSSHKVMIATLHSAEVADKKAEGSHTEEANWDSKVRAMLSELTSKNETNLDKAMVDGTRINCSPANRKLLQPENKKAVSESGFKMDDSTKDDKMLSKLESHAGGNVEAKTKEAGIVFIFMEPNTAASTNMASICCDKLIKLVSSCTKFACRVIKGVTRISKTVFVLSLCISNPQMVSAVGTCNSTAVTSPVAPQTHNNSLPPPMPMVSAVGTYNSSAVTSPLAPQTLNNTPPPPMPPSPVPKGGIPRLWPSSLSRMKKRSSLTESKEWALPPKQSPPSCLPDC